MKMIKNCCLAIAILCISVMMCGCSRNTPEKVIEDYFQAIANKDWDKATSYEYEKDPKKQAKRFQTASEAIQNRMAKKISNITILDSEIDGDNAKVMIQKKDTEHKAAFLLKKIDGKWLIYGFEEK